MFGNSAFNGMFRDGTIPKCERIIVEGEPAVLVCILGDPEHVRNFYNRYGFPQCVGAVDGTHIKIKRVVDNQTDYVNRKGDFTLIVKKQLDATIVLLMF